MELLVVIAIIGLLSTISLIGVNLAREKAKIAKAKHEVDQIYKAISSLATDAGQWPGHQEYNTVCTDLPGGCPADNEICGADTNGNTCANGLASGAAGIMQNDGAVPYDNWAGPYMPWMPDDPWGYEYFFDTDYLIHLDKTPCHDADPTCVDAVVVGSYGPDGQGKPVSGAAGAYGADDIIKILK